MTSCLWALVLVGASSVLGEPSCTTESLSLLQTKFAGVREPRSQELAFGQVNRTQGGCDWCWCLIESIAICGFDLVTSGALCGYSAVKSCTFDEVDEEEDEAVHEAEVALVSEGEASQGRRRRRRRRCCKKFTKSIKKVAKKVGKGVKKGVEDGVKVVTCVVNNVANSCNVPKSCNSGLGWKDCYEEITSVVGGFTDFVNDLGKSIGNSLNAMRDFFNDVANFLDKIFRDFLKGLTDGFEAVVQAVMGGVIGVLEAVINFVIDIFTAIGNILGAFMLEVDEDQESYKIAGLSVPECMEGGWRIQFGPHIGNAFVHLAEILSQGIYFAPYHWGEAVDDFRTAFAGYRNSFLACNIPFFESPIGSLCAGFIIAVLNKVIYGLNALLEAIASIGAAIENFLDDVAMLSQLGRGIRKRRQNPDMPVEELVAAVSEEEPEVALASHKRRSGDAWGVGEASCKAMDSDDGGIRGDWTFSFILNLVLSYAYPLQPLPSSFKKGLLWFVRGLIPQGGNMQIGLQLQTGCRWAKWQAPQFVLVFTFKGLYLILPAKPIVGNPKYDWCVELIFTYDEKGFKQPISIKQGSVHHRMNAGLAWSFVLQITWFGFDIMLFFSWPLIPYDWASCRDYDCRTSNKCKKGDDDKWQNYSQRYESQWCRFWAQLGDDFADQAMKTFGYRNGGGSLGLDLKALFSPPPKAAEPPAGDAEVTVNPMHVLVEEDMDFDAFNALEVLRRVDVSDVAMSALGAAGRHPAEVVSLGLLKSESELGFLPVPSGFSTGIMLWFDMCFATEARDRGSSRGTHCAGQWRDPEETFMQWSLCLHPSGSYAPNNDSLVELDAELDTSRASDFWGTDCGGTRNCATSGGGWLERAYFHDCLTSGRAYR